MGESRCVLCNRLTTSDDEPNAQIEASMCNLRGLLMLKLNRGDQAKHCFMEALALDVRCYEAFEHLVNGEMMTPEEGPHTLHPSRASADIRSYRVAVCAGPCVSRTNTVRR